MGYQERLSFRKRSLALQKVRFFKGRKNSLSGVQDPLQFLPSVLKAVSIFHSLPLGGSIIPIVLWNKILCPTVHNINKYIIHT